MQQARIVKRIDEMKQKDVDLQQCQMKQRDIDLQQC